MRGARRSMAEEADPWAMEDDEAAGWRCRKHHSSCQPQFGVCPRCLRDRLLRLCPDCANERPCGCLLLPSSSFSSSSSSSSSLSLTDFAGSVGGGVGIGAVGPVSRLIESEPAFQRSRSVGFQFLRTRSVASHADSARAPLRPKGARKWASFWPFSRAAARAAGPKDSAVTGAAGELPRSRSVGAAGLGGSSGREEKGKSWGWHFPSPMDAFRHRRSTKVCLHRG